MDSIRYDGRSGVLLHSDGVRRNREKKKKRKRRPDEHFPEPGRTGKEFSKKAAGCLGWPQESKIPRKTLIGLANQAPQWGVTPLARSPTSQRPLATGSDRGGLRG